MTQAVLSTPATAETRGYPAVAVAAAATAGLVLTYAFAVRTHVGQLLDTQAMLLVAAHLANTTWPQVLLNLITPDSVVLAVAALGLLVWAARGVGAAAVATGTAVGTILAAVVLKTVLVRPPLLDAAANSLPSGHVAAVAGLAAAAVAVTGQGLRTAVVLAGGAATALTGVATLALGWHRASDVLASGLLAVTVAATARATATSTAPDAVPLRQRATVPQCRGRAAARRSPAWGHGPARHAPRAADARESRPDSDIPKQ